MATHAAPRVCGSHATLGAALIAPGVGWRHPAWPVCEAGVHALRRTSDGTLNSSRNSMTLSIASKCFASARVASMTKVAAARTRNCPLRFEFTCDRIDYARKRRLSYFLLNHLSFETQCNDELPSHI